MVTIGAEDLVTRAEDLYGEGPVMFYYHKSLTRTIYFSLNIYRNSVSPELFCLVGAASV